MKIKFVFRLVLIFVVMFAFASGVNAFAEDIKARMRNRIPDIVSLKAEGIIGENYKGYLGFVTHARKMVDLIVEENSDRNKVYSILAQKTGTTVEIVGTQRGKKNAENAKPGEWLQNEQGTWYQK